MTKKAAFSLTDVLDAIDGTSQEARYFANTETGEIIYYNESYDSCWSDDEEDEDDEYLFENPEWVSLPDGYDIDDWRIMRDFAYALGGSVGDTLNDSIHGSGAFRAFRREVEREGLLQSWYAYKDMRYREIAQAWLEEHKLAWKDDLHENRKRDWEALLPTALRVRIELDVLEGEFVVCKLDAGTALPTELLKQDLCFVAKTPDELSIVCEASAAPSGLTAREDGWRVLRVAGPLDFGLVGIVSKISSALAQAEIPLFVVSTFDTDYVLVKAVNLEDAIAALESEGCVVNR